MPPTWANARRLLCVRLDAMGDVVMTEPALRALKQSAAGRSVTLLTSPAGAEAAGLLPGVDDVVVYEAPWMKASLPRSSSRFDRALACRLRGMRFEGAVIFTVYSQPPLPAAMLCYLADIPLRLAHSRENPYQLLTHWVRETEPQQGVRHEVQRQLDLVGEIGAGVHDNRIRLKLSASDMDAARLQLERIGVARERPWVVVHPGASAESRRWPAECFAEAADELSQAGVQIVFTGSRRERSLVESIQSQMRRPSYSVCGRLSAGELAAVLASAPLLIANNTGPVHLAAGVGTPAVVLYALTNPQHTPWRTPSRVLSFDVPCKYCYRSVCPQVHHDCLRRVTPAEVVKASLDLLAADSATKSRMALHAASRHRCVPPPRDGRGERDVVGAARSAST
ncbi:MAG: glycosyl transferase [Planctomycetota bacterium]|nr:MAG: glycosyl transferase [Planctomycetota bacterium]